MSKNVEYGSYDTTIDLQKYITQNHYADIESKGLYFDVHSLEDIWCLCSYMDDGTVILWHDYPEYCDVSGVDPYDKKEFTIPRRAGSLIEGFRYWYKIGMKKKGKLVIHNAHQYDRIIIEKVVPNCKIPLDTYHDTFIQSKVQLFDRSCPKGAKSPHGLKAFGIKCGVLKPDIKDWTTMDIFKLNRVIEDCRIQRDTYRMLEKERESLLAKGIDFSEATKIEIAYAMDVAQQEINGVFIDKPHIMRCLEQLDGQLEEARAIIEPMLPPTVKANTARSTRSAMMKSLGYTKIPKDEKEEVKKEGKMVWVDKKPYYTPSTNFHRVEKTNQYSGFHISYGESPTYVKKAQLTSWIKENHPDTKPKAWDIENIPKELKVLNKKACEYWNVEETDTDIIYGPHTKVTFSDSKMSQHEVVKGFLIKGGWKDAFEWNLKKDSDKKMVRAEEDTWVYYPKKAAPEHQMKFLVKKREPMVTSPKLTEDDFKFLPEGIGEMIGHYNTDAHRRRYLSNPKDPEEKGILAYIREDGRLSAGVNNFGTATGRGVQRKIVNLPAKKSRYGKEMRQCIIAPEGKVLVGADQKSSQLAIAAFVTNNVGYYNAVASGQEYTKVEGGVDIYVGETAHCINARNFGIVTKDQWEKGVDTQDPSLLRVLDKLRGDAKGPAFAVLFGCADKKLAMMLGIPPSEGKTKKDSFLREMGLNEVISWLQHCEQKYSVGKGFYIPTAFGYWVYCKSAHAAVNYLIQSIEGAVQKVGVTRFSELIIEQGLQERCMKILDTHDEFLVECDPDIADHVGRLQCEAYTYAGVQLQKWYAENIERFSGGDYPEITPDFAGGYAIGPSYFECH